ncbi:MAG: hypothetical protein AB7F74_00935 [Parvibaculaceae bacterium]
MKPRITINLTADGSLEIWLNETGRDLLVEQLQSLDENNDHLHFGQTEADDIEVSSRPYSPSDKILGHGKVLFRTDDWDRQYFPHVLDG